MANYASNSNADLGLVAETSLGVTPVTPTLVQQPFSSFSLSPSVAELTDSRKTGSRELSAIVTGNTTFSGTLTGPLSYSNYDTLLEAAMYGAWTANVLAFGSTAKSFTVEAHQKDIAKFVDYRGVMVNGFSIESPAEGLSTISLDLVALNMDTPATSIDATGYTPQPLFDAFKSCGGEIKEGGVTIAYVSSVSLSMSNNLNPLITWGDCDTSAFSDGNIDLTGSLSVFYVDDVMIDKFLAGSYSSLEFTLVDGAGNELSFLLPKIKYTGAELPIDEGSGERLITLPFRAVKDGTLGTGLQVTRTPA